MHTGLMDQNAQVMIPLSSQIALVAEWPKGGQYFFLQADETSVEQVNLRVLACSDKFVVSRAQDFPGARHLE